MSIHPTNRILAYKIFIDQMRLVGWIPSKIENNIKEARISTLQKIIELGFDGKLELK